MPYGGTVWAGKISYELEKRLEAEGYRAEIPVYFRQPDSQHSGTEANLSSSG